MSKENQKEGTDEVNEPPILAANTRNEISHCGRWVTVRVGLNGDGEPEYEWRLMSKCIVSQRGHYFPAETHVRYAEDGMIYSRSQMVENVYGDLVPSNITVTDYNGEIQLKDECYRLGDDQWALHDLVTNTRDGEYWLTEDCEEVTNELGSKHWYKSSYVVDLEGGSRQHRSNCVEVDSKWYPSSETVRCICPQGGYSMQLRVNTVIINDYYYLRSDTVICRGYRRPTTDCCKIGAKWHRKIHCVETCYKGWQVKANCVNVMESWYLREHAKETFNSKFDSDADEPDRMVAVPTNRGDIIWWATKNCVKTERYGWKKIENCQCVDGAWLPTERCAFLEDTDEWINRSTTPYWHIANEDIFVSVDAEGYVYSDRLNIHLSEDDDNYVWMERYNDYCHSSNASECRVCGNEYDSSSDNACCSERRNNNDRINCYHSSPTPNFYRDTPAKWDIGFEVEKETVNGCSCETSTHEVQPLFAGWEQDGSCGVEGITHVYGLRSQYSLFRDHVLASHYVDEPTNGSCGGHVNISRSGGLNLSDVKPYVGLLYSIYKNRLNGSYSSNNKRLDSCESNAGYAAIRSKSSSLLEFRLVARVDYGEDLLWRFKLFEMLTHAVDRQWSHEYYLRKMRPIMVDKFNEFETTDYYRTARQFNKWLTEGVMHPDIASYC